MSEDETDSSDEPKGFLSAMMPQLLERAREERKRLETVEVSLGFEDLLEAVRMTESGIKHHTEARDASFHSRLDAAVADPDHSFVDKPLFAGRMVELMKDSYTLPKIVRGSLLITVASHVELTLKHLCRKAARHFGLSRSLENFPRNDQRESDNHRAMRYLHEVATIAVADFETWPEWITVEGYRIVRNKLAHCGGVVERDAESRRIDALPDLHVAKESFFGEDLGIEIGPMAAEAAVGAGLALLERVVAAASALPAPPAT